MTEQGWRVEFYQDRRGREPVVDFVDGLRKRGAKHQDRVLHVLELLEDQGFGIGAKHLHKVRGSKVALWELRAQYVRNAYRILFYNPSGRTLVMLHAIDKKTETLDRSDVDTADRRATEDQARRNQRRS